MSRILIIDDEDDFAEALGLLLEDAGHQVDRAADGRQGLARLTRPGRPLPDAVLLDFMMPTLDGPAVLQAMQRSARLRSVPVVLMSAISEAAIADRCEGHVAFLHKPFDVAHLFRLIRHLTARRPQLLVGGLGR